ncbi:MAG: exodeoxyribonuclease VII small subunit [Bacteroidia bacterium]|nr:exodeoxyribonuclease VII small subunit [Bacteroidia bacterium]
MKKITSYEKAYQEIERILEDLVSDEVSVDELAKKVKRAKELITYCKEKLRDVEHDINTTKGDSAT